MTCEEQIFIKVHRAFQILLNYLQYEILQKQWKNPEIDNHFMFVQIKHIATGRISSDF